MDKIAERVSRQYAALIESMIADPKVKAALKNTLPGKYRRMSYDVGEAVGIVAAQSVAEPATQITLQSYHRAGGGGLHTTKGLPRVLEIFDAKREPSTPTMTIFLQPEFNTKEKAREIAASIKESCLKHVTKEDSLNMADMSIEVVLDADAMKSVGVNAKEVSETLSKNVKNIAITVKGSALNIEVKKKTSIKDLQALRIGLRDVHIKGIRGVRQGVVEKYKDEWVIYTIGSNLKKVEKIEGVDVSRTASNNIHEVASVLGIEAARNAIVKEIIETLREQGVDTDVRHVSLIADAMTSSGEIEAIGRYGLSGHKSSVLARANFEETAKHIMNAAVSGEADNLTGIVENVIIGKTALVGTGLVKIRMKTAKKPAAKKTAAKKPAAKKAKKAVKKTEKKPAKRPSKKKAAEKPKAKRTAPKGKKPVKKQAKKKAAKGGKK